VNRASRDFDRRMAQLDTELAVRRFEAEIGLLEIRMQQNRDLWYAAGMLAALAFQLWAERRKP